MRIVWRSRALAQLEAIHAYIARDNPQAAANVVAAIRATVAMLAEFPRSGQATNRPGYYTKLVPRYPYRVFYRIGADEVRIVRVRDVRRRPLSEQR